MEDLEREIKLENAKRKLIQEKEILRRFIFATNEVDEPKERYNELIAELVAKDNRWEQLGIKKEDKDVSIIETLIKMELYAESKLDNNSYVNNYYALKNASDAFGFQSEEYKNVKESALNKLLKRDNNMVLNSVKGLEPTL